MDCSKIREALTCGQRPAGSEVQTHLAECPPCRELLASNAALGRSLVSEVVAPALPEALFSSIELDLEREVGLRAWLRSRPSLLRFALALASVVVVVCLGGLLKHRPDLAAYPKARLLCLLGASALGIALAFRKELFALHRRASFSNYGWLLVAALGVPFLTALVPPTEASRAFGPEGALRCFSYGMLLTLPTAALLWAFDRDDRVSLRTVCLSAAALGLAASAILELHCPSANLRHVLLGHVTIGVTWLVAWAVMRQLKRV